MRVLKTISVIAIAATGIVLATSHFSPAYDGIADFVDGDSGFVGTTPVRLWCVDAPEYFTARGERASRFADSRIDGVRLLCQQRQINASYGRVVARCLFRAGPYNGRSVAAVLVEQGHASIYSSYCRAAALLNLI